ncbi:hypothetical protein C7271_06410 [filamentous cyanobacterium CCP5]|nr:hypothetical protein C7271_06410 [filamentous cyanobacterium CCP5]
MAPASKRDTRPQQRCDRCRIGKVVKSNSHCDYVVQVDDDHDVSTPPRAEDYGFGQFVYFENDPQQWTIGLVYNSQLLNPMFLSSGPRLSSEPDPMFTPDLIQETRTLLGVILIGTLEKANPHNYGVHGIPPMVVPVNKPVFLMQREDICYFHRRPTGQSQFSYFGHLMRSGGSFAPQLAQQVLSELISGQHFDGADQRALEVLCKEVAWKNTMGTMG